MTEIDKNNSWKKNAYLYLVSQIFSLFGSSIVDYLLIWYLTIKTQSGIIMTFAMLVTFLPRVLISLFVGKWIDAYSRKLIISLADGSIAVISLLLAIVFNTGNASLIIILSLMFVRTIGAGIQTPCEKAFIAEIIPEENLMQINSWNSGILSLINLLSPMIAGLLLTYASMSLAFCMDIITAIIAILILLSIKKVDATQNTNCNINTNKIGEKDLIKKIRYLNIICIFNFIFYILIVPITYLSNLFIVKNYGTQVWRLTANELIYGVGGLLGSIYLSRLNIKKDINIMILKYLMILGVFTGLVYKLEHQFFLYLIMVAIIAFMIVSIQIFLVTLIQENNPVSYHGRMFSKIEISTNVGLPIGMFLFGFLSDKINVSFIYLISGIMTILLSMSIFICIKCKTSFASA